MMPSPLSVSPLSSVLRWYQKKLGSYDQQSWEKTIEERVLRGISGVIPKKVARVKTDLIDLDLIRGSAFSKAKPKNGRVVTTCLGIMRVIFFPFYFKWWSDQTNVKISCLLLLLFCLQITSMCIYLNPEFGNDLASRLGFHATVDPKELDEIPASEVMFPLVLFMILSVIQSHIAASTDESSRIRVKRESSSLSVEQQQSKASRFTSNAGNLSTHVVRKTTGKRKKRSPEKKCLNNQRKDVCCNMDTTDKENEVPFVNNRKGSRSNDDENASRDRRPGQASANASRKPSDEESGLEIPDAPTDGCRKRNVPVPLTIISNTDRGSSESRNMTPDVREVQSASSSRGRKNTVTIRKKKPNGTCDHVMTGDEGDHENENDACGDGFSSLDEISPYSTVNSESWRRYSDIISHRIRSLSKGNRRFSNADESGMRPRSNTHIKHSRSRFSPSVQRSCHASSHPDLNISSNESEASVSPTVLNKDLHANTDLDWPMLNSEGTSEDEEEDERPQSQTAVFASEERHIYDQNPIFDGAFCDMYSRAGGQGAEHVSCAIYTQVECQKVDLSVFDISSAVIRKAEKARHSNEYLYLAFVIAIVLAAIPALYRLQAASGLNLNGHESVLSTNDADKINLTSKGLHNSDSSSSSTSGSSFEMVQNLMNQVPVPDPVLIWNSMIASHCCLFTRFIVVVAAIQRFCMSLFFFFLLCVAEHTYRERFFFAKYFCRLTSARRALGSDLPHFRLNKVRNIKTWLSVRSYLKKHGPQRSVDIIVSGGFILAVCILTFLCVQLLRETDTCSSRLYCWEMVSWDLALGIYILRLMILGIKTNRKYKSNLSVLITEQINLYLQLEQKPHKKEELTLANHVLKLAADLLKQLETPFKISGFSANHYLYNITKVVVLSAFSAVLTEMLGFKLKLHKIKL